jgi:hypothetical protein
MDCPAKRKMEVCDSEPSELKLTPEESALFEVLTDVVSHFKLNAVLRVAGGWVRDKLMVIFQTPRFSSTLH